MLLRLAAPPVVATDPLPSTLGGAAAIAAYEPDGLRPTLPGPPSLVSGVGLPPPPGGTPTAALSAVLGATVPRVWSGLVPRRPDPASRDVRASLDDAPARLRNVCSFSKRRATAAMFVSESDDGGHVFTPCDVAFAMLASVDGVTEPLLMRSSAESAVTEPLRLRVPLPLFCGTCMDDGDP